MVSSALRSLAQKISRRVEARRHSIIKRSRIEPIFRSISHDAIILEVGGGYNPRFVKPVYPNVYHLDHCSTEDLRTKYSKDSSVVNKIDRIQPIDFIFTGRPIETLIPPTLKFDLIYGSHVLEHQVDLIGHLRSLERLLKPGARVIEMIPDLHTCFDALRYPSVVSDALLVYLKPTTTHRGKQIFDFISMEISNNQGYMIRDVDFDGVELKHSLMDAYKAMQAAEMAGHPYIDVHAWTFTPDSFRLMMIELRLLGLTNLISSYVSPRYANQFCAVLERPNCNASSLLTSDARRSLERERLKLAIKLRVS